MQQSSSVEHLGRVVEKHDNVVKVGFVSHSSCASCHAKGVCAVSDVENKYVEIEDANNLYKLGEGVNIILEQKQGFKALWLGYVLPLLVLLLAMIITYSITHNDGLAGLVALGVLLPYYFILYLLRAYLKNKFTFKLKKID